MYQQKLNKQINKRWFYRVKYIYTQKFALHFIVCKLNLSIILHPAVARVQVPEKVLNVDKLAILFNPFSFRVYFKLICMWDPDGHRKGIICKG